jgi:hypothetical protein
MKAVKRLALEKGLRLHRPQTQKKHLEDAVE